MQYYGLVSKLDGMTMKYGTVMGTRGRLTEKNLDTQLVADMVIMAARNEFDIAILVSNDGDFVSAVRPVKELGKRVEILYFKGEVSMALKRECDIARRARPSYFARLSGAEKEK